MNIIIIRMLLINSFVVAGSVNWITFFGYEYGFFEISYSTMIICADTFGLIAIIAQFLYILFCVPYDFQKVERLMALRVRNDRRSLPYD